MSKQLQRMSEHEKKNLKHGLDELQQAIAINDESRKNEILTKHKLVIEMECIWKRVLTSDERDGIWANPYVMFGSEIIKIDHLT